VQRLTGRVVKAKDRILTLLDEIKQYGKQKEEALDLHPTPIHTLMEDTLAIVSLDPDVHGMEVTPSFAEGFSVSCDKNKIIQILINLIRNAAQAMNKTGTIFLNVKEEGNAALIEVVDQGAGIPPEHIEQIWKPFFSTKGDEGTGLGLAICQKIAAAHKGRLHCESTVGKGTTFTLSLPKQ
ncbi:GHKL domain-containing protein, partial [bacterium]|nr:GHKL domain-containing protein [bacterium]